MRPKKPQSISVESALRLVDLIRGEARRTESELAKKILLRAGIKIADLALAGETGARKLRRAA